GLKNERRIKWKNNEDAFMYDLQKRCFDWLKEVRKNHTEFARKTNASGGAGADTDDEGDPENAIHPFEFMSGSIPTMLWEDGIALLGGDDSKSGAGEAIIPDSHPGSGSSVPGGPGVRTAKERVRTGAQDPTTVSKESTVKVEKRDRK
ncbi:unnamed protein product, partial [Pylaiella littoralis]